MNYIDITKTLYKYFNQNNNASSIMGAYLEETITMIDYDMIDDVVIDWEKNTREFFREKLTNEVKHKVHQANALALLREGLSIELINKITQLPLDEIQKLKESIFQSSEQSAKPVENTVIDTKPDTQDMLRDTWINEVKNEGKREDALAMLREGCSHEFINKITQLPLEEIQKLQPSQA